jgi:hypothetical protein
MAAFAQRITVVSLDGAHRGQSATLYKKKKKKKRKVSGFLKPFERNQRRLLNAADAFTGTSRRRHRRSSRKRRDRWLTDIPVNNLRAANKAFRKLRIF